ncbi:dihydroorotate dehydrogenase B (NAD(+)), electron transfer subunit [Clostridia bacterium]|nr:dihydroorotate dehydrogenase B (NAD(+)), electron transfer subunit [Clostridia bacterium]
MKDIQFTVESNEKKAPGVWRMRFICAESFGPVLGGQFLHLEIPNRPDMPLRRPFCIYQYDRRSVTIVYAAVGAGTEAMTDIRPGQTVKCLLPLGNGFDFKVILGGAENPRAQKDKKRVALVGGGLGAAPLLPVIGEYPAAEFHAYLGFANAAVAAVFTEDFQNAARNADLKINLFTDDGSAGVKGFPTAALDRDIGNGLRFDAILTCGPHPLMKAVRGIAVKYDIDAFMSGENRMACGAGACLTCTCAVRGADGAEHNLRACVDGPVFDLTRIAFN